MEHQIVRRRLPHRRRQQLHDPEIHGDFRNLEKYLRAPLYRLGTGYRRSHPRSRSFLSGISHLPSSTRLSRLPPVDDACLERRTLTATIGTLRLDNQISWHTVGQPFRACRRSICEDPRSPKPPPANFVVTSTSGRPCPAGHRQCMNCRTNPFPTIAAHPLRRRERARVPFRPWPGHVTVDARQHRPSSSSKGTRPCAVPPAPWPSHVTVDAHHFRPSSSS